MAALGDRIIKQGTERLGLTEAELAQKLFGVDGYQSASIGLAGV